MNIFKFFGSIIILKKKELENNEYHIYFLRRKELENNEYIYYFFLVL